MNPRRLLSAYLAILVTEYVSGPSGASTLIVSPVLLPSSAEPIGDSLLM